MSEQRYLSEPARPVTRAAMVRARQAQEREAQRQAKELAAQRKGGRR